MAKWRGWTRAGRRTDSRQPATHEGLGGGAVTTRGLRAFRPSGLRDRAFRKAFNAGHPLETRIDVFVPLPRGESALLPGRPTGRYLWRQRRRHSAAQRRRAHRGDPAGRRASFWSEKSKRTARRVGVAQVCAASRKGAPTWRALRRVCGAGPRAPLHCSSRKGDRQRDCAGPALEALQIGYNGCRVGAPLRSSGGSEARQGAAWRRDTARHD